MEDLTRSIEDSQERLLKESQEKIGTFNEKCEEFLEDLTSKEKEEEE